MRLKQLSSKEVIDIKEGKKLGVLGQADLTINPESGEILSLIILNKGLFHSRGEIVIDWNHVEIIGEDTILINS
ncbi:YlmC/YmxH family sporulation protein [Halobacillus sp. A5]|uniref:YlmC/YmxH family sporulation protein n=1 Tax=Halobacillus sp. A5 TaxID=2880263 RepID=UPI0020A6D2A2|nr:YlmC/YmxH family sporulation protein [Halobacillus sp. A5]MCP3026072.1 YlmC/YmxH family sporulation protein [Halobacillus sp. A5]